MGWSNVGAVVLFTTALILVDANGDQDGSLDGLNGLILYGDGSAADPAFQLTPFGDVVWSSQDGSTNSIEIEDIADDQFVNHPAMVLSTSTTVSTTTAAYLVVYGRSFDGSSPPGVCVAGGYLVGSDPTVAAGPPISPESWHAMTLQAGWTSGAGSGFDAPSYRITADGRVEFKGLALAGTKTNGTTIATLPSGYRPPVTRQLLASADSNISPFIVILHVTTGGAIQIFALGTGDAIGLDNVGFSLT